MATYQAVILLTTTNKAAPWAMAFETVTAANIAAAKTLAASQFATSELARLKAATTPAAAKLLTLAEVRKPVYIKIVSGSVTDNVGG